MELPRPYALLQIKYIVHLNPCIHKRICKLFQNIFYFHLLQLYRRRENEKQRIRRETAIRKGRTYEDFKEYIGKHPESSIVEMDTVEGKKGGKVFLTLLFRKSKFMLIYLMEKKCI